MNLVLAEGLSRNEVKLNKWFLNEFVLLGSGSSRKKSVLRRHGFKRIEAGQLKSLYLQLVRNLNQRHLMETKQTMSEKGLEKFLKAKRVRFLKSVWIGRHNVDFYLPNYRLVIEVNGGVHDLEFKMKKDNYRDMVLMEKLGLYSMEVMNDDVLAIGIKLSRFLSEKKNRINSNIVKNNWRRIYIETLSRFVCLSQLELGGDLKGAEQELRARRVIV